MDRYTFPVDYDTADCVLIEINKTLVPFVAGALRVFEHRFMWATPDDYRKAYNAFVELQAHMANNCLERLIAVQENTYRLLDTTFNGTAYAAEYDRNTNELTAITPPIPVVPPIAPNSDAAMRSHVGRMWALNENAATARPFVADAFISNVAALDYEGSWIARLRAVQGLTGGFLGIGANPVTLADLLKAGRVNTEADQGLINNGIEEVLNAIANGSSIGTVLSSLLNTGADIATDGGLAAVQIAAMVANSVTGATQLGLLQRIIRSLDGAGVPQPGSLNNNVLSRLGRIHVALDGGDGAGSAGSATNNLLNALNADIDIGSTADGTYTAAGLLVELFKALYTPNGSKSVAMQNIDRSTQLEAIYGRLLALTRYLPEPAQGQPTQPQLLQTLLGSQAAQLGRIIAALDGGGQAAPGAAGNNLLLHAATTATRLMDNAGENSAGQTLRDIYERLEEVRAALRAPGDTSSISDRLLRLSQQLAGLVALNDSGDVVMGAALQVISQTLDCICEGVSGEPGTENPQNAPPPGPCFQSGLVLRMTTWVSHGTKTIDGQVCTIWSPIFAQFPNDTGLEATGVVGSGERIWRQKTTAPANSLCVGWNFTNTVKPLRVQRLIGPTDSSVTGWFNPGPEFSGFNYTLQIDSNDFPAATSVSAKRIGYQFAFPGTALPSDNVFARAIILV